MWILSVPVTAAAAIESAKRLRERGQISPVEGELILLRHGGRFDDIWRPISLRRMYEGALPAYLRLRHRMRWGGLALLVYSGQSTWKVKWFYCEPSRSRKAKHVDDS